MVSYFEPRSGRILSFDDVAGAWAAGQGGPVSPATVIATDNAAAIAAAFARPEVTAVFLAGDTSAIYKISALTIPTGKRLYGDATVQITGSGLVMGDGSSLEVAAVTGGVAKGNSDTLVSATNKSGFRIIVKNLSKSRRTGVNLSGCSAFLLDLPVASDTGSDTVDFTYQGAIAYLSSCSYYTVNVGDWSGSWGHAALFQYNSTGYNVVNGGYVHDTRYRAYEVYGAGTSGRIRFNGPTGFRTGALAPPAVANNGVGTNGLFIQLVPDKSVVEIYGSYFEDVGENFIEGPCRIFGGSGLRSGYAGLDTPSKEGLWPSSYGMDIYDYSMRDTVGSGFKYIGVLPACNIDGLRIENAGDIPFNAQPTSGVVSNFNVNNVQVYKAGATGVGFNLGPTGGATVDSATCSVTNSKSNYPTNLTSTAFSKGNTWGGDFGSAFNATQPFKIGTQTIWVQSGGSLRTLAGTPAADTDGFEVPRMLGAVFTYDPPSLAAATTSKFTRSVTGAAVGDYAMVSHDQTSTDIYWNGTVTAADTVTVRQINDGTGAVDLASGNLRIRVIKR